MIKQITVAILCISLFTVSSISAAVWKDDFEGAEIDENWTPATWRVNAPTNWKVEDGVLKASWPLMGSCEMLLLEEYPSLDYTIQVKGRIDRVRQASSYAGPGIVFRSSGPAGNTVTPFYSFGLIGFRTLFFIGHNDMNWRDADVTPGNYDIDQWYTLKVIVSGKDFLGYVDDKLVCELSDRLFKGKFVGLCTGDVVDVSFDDFMITDQVDEDAFLNLHVSPEGTMATTWARLKTY